MLVDLYSEWSISTAKLNLFMKKVNEKVSKLWDIESEPLKNFLVKNSLLQHTDNHCVIQNLSETR